MNEGRTRSGNACQPAAGIACGACCGLFNLKLSDDLAVAARERARILRERSQAFARVRFDTAEDFVAYRAAREGREGAIPRHDSETYVCPFYGPLTPPEPAQLPARPNVPGFRAPVSNESAASAAPGCMAHPLRTGLKHTQNFSFYGASICQAYDCRNKDRDPQGQYSRLLVNYVRLPERSAFDERYTRLMADLPLFAFLERVPGLLERLCAASEGAAPADWERPPLAGFELLARSRLIGRHTQRVTSFEIELSRYPDPRSELRALLADMMVDSGAETEPVARAENQQLPQEHIDALCDEIYPGLCEPGPPPTANL